MRESIFEKIARERKSKLEHVRTLPNHRDRVRLYLSHCHAGKFKSNELAYLLRVSRSTVVHVVKNEFDSHRLDGYWFYRVKDGAE